VQLKGDPMQEKIGLSTLKHVKVLDRGDILDLARLLLKVTDGKTDVICRC
jgi:hypothetical protein